jgi:hypothetical protein
VEFKDSVTEADLPKYGLAEPTRQIKLRAPATNGDTNTTLVDISVGELLTNNVVYVQRADEKNSVYALGILDYARLAAEPWQFRERQLSSRISAVDAPGLPYAMFSSMVPPKRITSWGTIPKCARYWVRSN